MQDENLQNPNPQQTGPFPAVPEASHTVGQSPSQTQVSQTQIPQPMPQSVSSVPTTPPQPQQTQSQDGIPSAHAVTTNSEPNKNKKTLVIMVIVLLLLILIAAGGFYFLQMRKTESEQPQDQTGLSQPQTIVSSPTPQVTQALDVTANWPIYDAGSYLFKYPLDANINESSPSAVSVNFTGPTQTEGTEFFDGYSITFTPIEPAGLTLLDYVNSKVDEINSGGAAEVTQGPDPVTVNTYEGYTYITEGLGEFETIVLESPSGELFIEISSMAVDPGNLGFEQIVSQILSTFQFVE